MDLFIYLFFRFFLGGGGEVKDAAIWVKGTFLFSFFYKTGSECYICLSDFVHKVTLTVGKARQKLMPLS